MAHVRYAPTYTILVIYAETLKSVFMQDPYKLKVNEEWPEEVAHLFGNKREGEDVKGRSKLDTLRKNSCQRIHDHICFRGRTKEETPEKAMDGMGV